MKNGHKSAGSEASPGHWPSIKMFPWHMTIYKKYYALVLILENHIHQTHSLTTAQFFGPGHSGMELPYFGNFGV
jgi:hypothetical protein